MRASDTGSVDAPLATVLSLKPVDDPIPLEVWWLVVSSLESAVVVRRVMEGVEPPPEGGIAREIARAQQAARAALDALDEQRVGSTDSEGRALSNMEPSFVLRCTILQLARMAVRSRATPVRQLSCRLAAHLRVLSLCEAANSQATTAAAGADR